MRTWKGLSKANMAHLKEINIHTKAEFSQMIEARKLSDSYVIFCPKCASIGRKLAHKS